MGESLTFLPVGQRRRRKYFHSGACLFRVNLPADSTPLTQPSMFLLLSLTSVPFHIHYVCTYVHDPHLEWPSGLTLSNVHLFAHCESPSLSTCAVDGCLNLSVQMFTFRHTVFPILNHLCVLLTVKVPHYQFVLLMFGSLSSNVHFFTLTRRTIFPIECLCSWLTSESPSQSTCAV